jgi:hypothetical protein
MRSLFARADEPVPVTAGQLSSLAPATYAASACPGDSRDSSSV